MSRIKTPEQLLVALAAGGFIGAQISGGFLRDRHIGRQPKDLDVFIQGRNTLGTEQVETLLYHALGGFGRVSCQFDMSYGEMSEVWRVYQTDLIVQDVPVQVIELADGLNPAERWKQYDFGACQISMGLDGIVCTTCAFEQDMVDKTFTLAGQMTQKEYERSLRRWARWAPELEPMGWKLVDKAEILKEFEALDLDAILR